MTKSQLANAHGISRWLLAKWMAPHAAYIDKKSPGPYTPAELRRVHEALGYPMGKAIGPGELAGYYNIGRGTIVVSWIKPFREYAQLGAGKVLKLTPKQLVLIVDKLDLPEKTDAFFAIVEQRLQSLRAIGKNGQTTLF